MLLKNISKSFGEKEIFKDLSFELPEGSITAIKGASGRGKTTLVNIIAGIEKPDTGEVIDVQKPIAMVFQEDRLLPWLNVVENIGIVGGDTVAMEYAKKVGLGEVATEDVSTLSGGMQRRVALARALSADFATLILDEPFTGLDDKTKAEMKRVIKEELNSRTCILISHDDDEIKNFADNIIFL